MYYIYIYICIFLFEVWTCSSDIPNNTKESFKRKAAMSVSRTRSKTTKVKAGYYSEETLRSTHKLSQSLVFDAVFVSKTISTSNAYNRYIVPYCSFGKNALHHLPLTNRGSGSRPLSSTARTRSARPHTSGLPGVGQ